MDRVRHHVRTTHSHRIGYLLCMGTAVAYLTSGCALQYAMTATMDKTIDESLRRNDKAKEYIQVLAKHTVKPELIAKIDETLRESDGAQEFIGELAIKAVEENEYVAEYIIETAIDRVRAGFKEIAYLLGLVIAGVGATGFGLRLHLVKKNGKGKRHDTEGSIVDALRGILEEGRGRASGDSERGRDSGTET